MTVTPANAVGLNTSGASGQIIANGMTVNLAASGTTGGMAQSGAHITFNNSTLNTTATNANAASQTGLRASGNGSTIAAGGATISMQPSPNNASSSNNVGASADSGGSITFTNAAVQMGGSAGASNHGLRATGSGSMISFSGGAVSTAARGSFGAFAQGGGTISLSNGATVTTTGTQIASPAAGSHGLYSLGSGSTIDGTGITVSVSGQIANGARAEAGGVLDLADTDITTSGNNQSGNTTDFATGVQVLSGGQAKISDGSTVSTSGRLAPALGVRDTDSMANVSDTALEVTGIGSNTVAVTNGGQATLLRSTVRASSTTTPSSTFGVFASGTGTSVSLVNTSVIGTAAKSVHGVRATNGADVNVSGGSVATTGQSSVGLWADLNGTLTIDNVAVTTSGGGGAMGILADKLDGSVMVTGGSVTTTGDEISSAERAHGLAARDGGTLVSTGTQVHTTGIGGMGGAADDGGRLFLTGNRITTEGAGALGLYATTEHDGAAFAASIDGDGLTIETSGALAHGAAANQHFFSGPTTITFGAAQSVSVTTHGAGSIGLLALQGGDVIATNTHVVTHGTGAAGVRARDEESLVSLDPTTVLTTGEGAHAAVADAGGRVTGVETSLTATGASASALYAAGASGSYLSTAAFTRSTLSNMSGPTIAVGGHGDVTLTDSTAGGSGQWLKVGTVADFAPLTDLGAGPDGIAIGIPTGVDDPDEEAASPSFLAPAPMPVEAGLANIDLIGSTVTGSAQTLSGSVSNLNMSGGSLWNLTGNSNISNLINDASAILFSPPNGVFKTLTVQTYHGANGAVLGLNTFLQEDVSPSDLLVVDGGLADGATKLRITHAGGLGAVTTADGIRVVDAVGSGQTTADAFTLENGRVSAGVYDYFLFRGGKNPVDFPDDWFLRSTGMFRPETSTYAAPPAMMLVAGRQFLGNLHERVGEEEQLRFRDDFGDDDFNGAWVRAIGWKGDFQANPVEAFDDSGPSYAASLFGIQAGLDLYRSEDSSGVRRHGGIYAGVGSVTADVTHFTGASAGRATVSTTVLGGTWTRFGPAGQYLDAVAQASWYDIGAVSGGNTFAGSAFGVALSLEAGRPFHLKDRWLVEPQAQLVYQTVLNGHGADEGGAVSFQNVNSLSGRLGVRVARNYTFESDTGEPRQLTLWLRPNLWHEFLPSPTTVFDTPGGPVPFTSNLPAWWAQINAGATLQIDRSAYLYGNLGYSFDFAGHFQGIDGKVGLRMNW